MSEPGPPRPTLLPRAACGALLGLLAGCATAPSPVRVPQSGPPVVSCETATDADFEGEGEERFWRYLDWIVRAHGAHVGLMPYHVSLGLARGMPKPGPGGVTAGEVSCDGNRYRITLFRDALSGRPLQVAYRTLAHEFFHVVQVRRDDLACGAGEGGRAAYESEALAFSAGVVPACRARALTAPPPTGAALRTRDRCDAALAADFEGAAAADWQRFVDELARSHGTGFGLPPGSVRVAISGSAPRPGLRGVIAADIGCGGTGAERYRITLYRRALEGRSLNVVYHTLVREFHHIVQMQRDRLACEGGDAASAEYYEREALAVADWLVPACR